MKNYQEPMSKCPYITVQRILSGKWALLILCYLRNGPMRFGELQGYIVDLTQTTLTKQLRKLESDGLIERKVFPEIPPHVEYNLSEIGKELTEVLCALEKFGFRYIEYMSEHGKGIREICKEARTNSCRCCTEYSKLNI